MRRVSLGGDALNDFPAGQDGGYLKLMIPSSDDSDRGFVRTYTIRHQRPDALDLDFALHGNNGEGGEGGPAVTWSQTAQPGDKITAGGPGPAKPLAPDADWYFVLGDMTALPAIAVNLASLPPEATGIAVIEIQEEEDRQALKHPAGFEIQWVVNPYPGKSPDQFEKIIRGIPWQTGRVYAWSATEFDVMRRTRAYLRDERGLGSDQLYISSYWKSGLAEDQHREVKQADAAESAST